MDAAVNIADLADFVSASPSSYHAVAEVARRLREAGFAEQSEAHSWEGLARGFVIRDGAVIAWRLPEPTGAEAGPDRASLAPVGFRIVGAHTDSPGFKVKPQPSAYAFGFAQAAVEVYGGPLLNSWLDREFGLAGRVVTRSGAVKLVSTGPWLRIPQLAPHLDRSVNESLHLDRQQHLKPIFGLGAVDLLAGVAASLGLHADEIDAFDLFAAVSEAPAVIGLGGEFLASARLDNLSSVHAGLTGLLAASASDQVQVLACFDHEEIGSDSRSGAAGPFLEDVLGRLAGSLGWEGDDRAVAIARSFMISADAGHSLHPNYPGMHDPDHQPVLNAGPLLKVNANQRYTTEGPGTARWLRVCRAAGVPTQPFVSNNAVPCGSTIGPLSATRLGIESIDVGVPLLSMHSARELCGVQDAAWLADGLRAFYQGAGR